MQIYTTQITGPPDVQVRRWWTKRSAESEGSGNQPTHKSLLSDSKATSTNTGGQVSTGSEASIEMNDLSSSNDA
jgi:hypothetical protein